MEQEQIKDVLAVAELQVSHNDALEVNETAARVGLVWAHLKRAAADKEANRKELQQSIQAELVAGGLAKTNAEPASRADERYVAYLKDLAEMSEQRDRAEVLHKVLLVRSQLLA